ncbi:MAG: J domain-containing protein [Pseudomonadota bacterium]
MRRRIALFDALGVRPEDDIAKIRAAWRKKVKALHPDIAKDKERSAKLLAQVNAAFDELKAHKPFAERRRGDRRNTWRSKRVWSPAERMRKRATAADARQDDQKRQQAKREAAQREAAVQQAMRRQHAEDLARRNAAELERKEAAARTAARARNAKVRRAYSKQEESAYRAASTGYAQARAAMSV